MTAQAAGVIAPRPGVGDGSVAFGAGRAASVDRQIIAAMPVLAIASTTYGPRQPNTAISPAMIGAPTSSAIAHDVSYRPIDRARCE